MREQRLATKARTYDFGRAAGFFIPIPPSALHLKYSV